MLYLLNCLRRETLDVRILHFSVLLFDLSTPLWFYRKKFIKNQFVININGHALLTNLPFLVTIISLVSLLNRDQSSTSSSSARGWSGLGSMIEAVLVGKGSVVVDTVISPYCSSMPDANKLLTEKEAAGCFRNCEQKLVDIYKFSRER